MNFSFFIRAFALNSLFILSLYSSNLKNLNFIYKDELNFSQQFYDEVNKLGNELFQKTGISVYMVVYSSLQDKHLITLEKELISQLPKKSVILGFTGSEHKVDIFANKTILKLFDKEQILSPYPWSGTILPILGEKIKGDPRRKYAVALFNGYADIIEQIAKNSNIQLENGVGNSNKFVLNILRLIFYSVILFSLFYVIYRKYIKKELNDKNSN
jgi:hypothetical protein